MSGHAAPDESYVYEPWYKYGIYFLFFEAAIAVGVTIYSLSMTFSGETVQFKIKKVHTKPVAVITAPAPVANTCAALQQQLDDCLNQAGLKK
ncbi:MAG: hypothetical protein L3J28_03710 [Candidatus Polarisedimenticolaceae bacterium]|nr:hypothetical protein [Candidatus Polarisedimenticolaceae bacterium]